jgi:hypothetical protein
LNRQLISAVSIVALLVALVPAPAAHALPDREIHYTVIYRCLVGPFHNRVVGEWTLACNGEMYGWGESPYGPCTETQVVEGESCGIEPPLEP